MKLPIRVGSIELINHPLTMVRHFRKDGSVGDGGETIDVSQFVFVGDIHLDNLGPKGIVGGIQLDSNWGCSIFSGRSRDLGFG